MPTITINGRPLEFQKGQMILQVALDNEIEIPHYCYHPGLSIVANCRICLAEVWAPNPRNDNKLEPIPKLLPTCQTPCGEGQVVYTDSPRAIANQKAVMEYLLINHPVDCPVCDQAGECHLQDYSYQYGRGVARFQEEKIKQPKKDVGKHVLLYSDRCIMCTRCVRFTREVTGTGELLVTGRGATEQIDVFPGVPIDNELSANVIDICPVGALLDKDFLFQQRVWFLTKTPSIDGITASGDNISIEHNRGVIYRIKPRTNMEVNKWWITDEVRYGWKFVHSEDRLTMPAVKGEDPFDPAEASLAWETAYEVMTERLKKAKKIALMVSPMLACEDAYLLAEFVLSVNPQAVLALGPVPFHGEDKTFPGSVGKLGFKLYAEKAPNARGVRRALAKLSVSGKVMEYDELVAALQKDAAIDTVIVTGNYPSEWVTDELRIAIDSVGGSAVSVSAGRKKGTAQTPAPSRFVILIDTLRNRLVDRADILIPAATWAEKTGTFENANGRLQSFERAIPPIDYTKSEAQIALDLMAFAAGDDVHPEVYNAATIRQRMAERHGLSEFVNEVHLPPGVEEIEADMELVEL